MSVDTTIKSIDAIPSHLKTTILFTSQNGNYQDLADKVKELYLNIIPTDVQASKAEISTTKIKFYFTNTDISPIQLDVIDNDLIELITAKLAMKAEKLGSVSKVKAKLQKLLSFLYDFCCLVRHVVGLIARSPIGSVLGNVIPCLRIVQGFLSLVNGFVGIFKAISKIYEAYKSGDKKVLKEAVGELLSNILTFLQGCAWVIVGVTSIVAFFSPAGPAAAVSTIAMYVLFYGLFALSSIVDGSRAIAKMVEIHSLKKKLFEMNGVEQIHFIKLTKEEKSYLKAIIGQDLYSELEKGHSEAFESIRKKLNATMYEQGLLLVINTLCFAVGFLGMAEESFSVIKGDAASSIGISTDIGWMIVDALCLGGLDIKPMVDEYNKNKYLKKMAEQGFAC